MTKDPNAVALGSKGGKARAKSLTASERSNIARKAGKARLEALTPAERKQIASNAAKKRWGKRRKK